MTLATAKMVLASLLAMLSIWLYTASGLAQGSDDLPLPGQVYRYPHNPNDPASLSNNFAVSIFVDSQDNIWIGTWGGRAQLSGGGCSHSFIPHALDLTC